MDSSISKITQLWDKSLSLIKDRVEKSIYDSFFTNSYINEINDNTNTIVIVTNSQLGANLLAKKYYDLIFEAVSEITETNFKLEFVFQGDLKKKAPQIETVESVKKSSYFQNSFINSKLTFDNFVVGDFNREASQASLLIASNPGRMFNPLFLYSNTGLGKTHLLHSIANYIIRNGNPNAKILYITANDFVDEYIKFVKGDKDSESFSDFMSRIDVLLIDDVQFLAEKVKTEEMFFHVFQRLINDGKQIVITSDRQPSELKNLEDRLVSRFSQGLIIKIDEPDQEACVEILKKKIQSNNLNVDDFDDEVLNYCASKFSKNVRELEGGLNKLIFSTIKNHSNKITMEEAMVSLSSLTGVKASSSQLTEIKIINTVADYYNLAPSQLTGKIRTGQISLARHIAMYLIREMLDLPLKKIGATFGGKDHTTVMSALIKVDKELKNNNQLKEAIAELKKRIK